MQWWVQLIICRLQFLHVNAIIPVPNCVTLKWSQCWAAGWMIGVLGFDCRRGLGTFLLTTVSRTALGSTHPPIRWVPGALSLGVKRPGHEADHSPPSGAEAKEWVELYLHSPNTPSWRGTQLKHGENLIPLPLYYNCRRNNANDVLVQANFISKY
jgi:hypothetical protein